MSDKQVRGKYTQEFKLEAVRQVKAGQLMPVTAKVLGTQRQPEQLGEAKYQRRAQ